MPCTMGNTGLKAVCNAHDHKWVEWNTLHPGVGIMYGPLELLYMLLNEWTWILKSFREIHHVFASFLQKWYFPASNRPKFLVDWRFHWWPLNSCPYRKLSRERKLGYGAEGASYQWGALMNPFGQGSVLSFSVLHFVVEFLLQTAPNRLTGNC